jgi:hypothetical protein
MDGRDGRDRTEDEGRRMRDGWEEGRVGRRAKEKKG